MNEIATNDFDYSLLDAKTKEFLEASFMVFKARVLMK